MHQAQSVPKKLEKTKRAKPGSNVILEESAKIAKCIKKLEDFFETTLEEISESGNKIAQAFSQYATYRDEEMASTLDKIQIASGNKMYDFVMNSVLLDDAGKDYVNDKFNVGREKKFHRKRKPIESNGSLRAAEIQRKAASGV